MPGSPSNPVTKDDRTYCSGCNRLPAECTCPPVNRENVTYLPPADELRRWADHPAESGFVPVHPCTLRAIADELDSIRKVMHDR